MTIKLSFQKLLQHVCLSCLAVAIPHPHLQARRCRARRSENLHWLLMLSIPSQLSEDVRQNAATVQVTTQLLGRTSDTRDHVVATLHQHIRIWEAIHWPCYHQTYLYLAHA